VVDPATRLNLVFKNPTADRIAAGSASGPAAEVAADPRWFPLRFEVETQKVHFAFVPAETHRHTAFLTELSPSPAETRVLPRSTLGEIRIREPRLHLILHSGLGGSTLLARAVSQAGVATVLQEPPILTDVIAYALKNSHGDSKALLDDVTRWLSRPLSPGEAVVCKMNSIGNGLCIPMAALDPGSQILCLETPLEEMLTSFASRGSEGRAAARKLLIGLRNARMFPLDLSDKDLNQLTDLQLCALAWLSMRKLMADAAARFGPDRFGTITSHQLLHDTADTLEAVGRHFRLTLDVQGQLASGIFDRHAKTGERFNAKKRAERVARTLRAHQQEIRDVVSWAAKVADQAEIAHDLPYPLLP
jgi:hypothetical protein